MTDALHVVILAAGKGSRMFSTRPKVLHRIGAQSMLSRVIAAAKTLAPATISVVVGHGKEAVMAEILDSVQWVTQATQLGTGHAVLQALPAIHGGRVLVLYGDVPLINHATLQALLDAATSGLGLLVDVLENPTGYGRIVRDAVGNVAGIVEEKDASPEQKALREVNTGILVAPYEKLVKWLNSLESNNAQGEYYLTDIIALAVKDNIPVATLQVPYSHLALGVNNKAQLQALERCFQCEMAETLMQNGLMLRDAQRFDLRGTLQHGVDVEIDVNVVLEGDVVLGDNVKIGANCVIKNAMIERDTVIEAFSHLEDCTVGEGCRIGPFARLRPKTKLENDCRIGNFVELKNTHMGSGSKANHLSYLGDATIGAACNFGALSVTCNYDGANKHPTTIGSSVFVGSNTLFVAPVTVENDATTGAGSVITKPCPAGKLTLARAKQVTLASWSRPKKGG